MGLIRTDKESGDWFIGCKAWAEDETLSWEARGLLAYLFAKPDDWEVSMVDLVKSGPCKKYKVRRIFKEIREAGYAHRRRERSDEGTFQYITTVYERPSPTQSGMDSIHHGDDRGYTKETVSTKDTKGNSSGGSARAREELPEEIFPLYDVYREEMEQALEEYPPEKADTLVMNKWGQVGITSTTTRLATDYSHGYFVAGVVITANEADSPNPRYLDTLLQSLTQLDNELDTDNPSKHEQQSNLERLWNAARTA